MYYNIINNEYFDSINRTQSDSFTFLRYHIYLPNDFKSQSFIQNIHRTSNDESFINNNIIIENH